MKLELLLALGLALTACVPTPAPVPPMPEADAATPAPIDAAWPLDPWPMPAARDACQLAFDHLTAIGCPPRGPESGTWVDVCRNARRHGLFSLRCINEAGSRAAAEKCHVGCR